MDRRFFLTICGGALISALPAFAGSFEDAVLKQLRSQGYKKITVEQTLLGRTRITALSAAGRREIVLNPRTGEVLRDVLTAADGSVAPLIANTSGSDSSGHSDDTGGSSGSDDSGDDNGSGDNGSGDGGSGDSGGSGSSGGGDSSESGDSESESEGGDDGKDD